MAIFTKPGLSHHTTLGGTGISIDRTDQGSLLIGDGEGFKLNTLVGGTGITIVNGDGTITISGIPAYTLPTASASVLGGIKVGANLSIDGGGVLSGLAPYILPTASGSVLGGIKVGANLSIDGGGVLSALAPYVLPIASATVLGGVKVGSGLAITTGGVLSVGLYPSAIAVDTPSAYYRLGDAIGAGSALDSSGNGNTGSVGGVVTFGQVGALVGDPNTAADVQSGGGVTCPISYYFLSPTSSHEMWFVTSTPGRQGIFASSTSSNYSIPFSGYQALNFWCYLNSSGHLAWTNAGAISSVSYTDGIWHHLVVTIDSGSNLVTFYVDGASIGTCAVTPSASQITQFWTYGASNTDVTNYFVPFGGKIDEVTVYINKVLTPDRVLSHYFTQGVRDIPASIITGVLPTAHGGTGVSTASNGQLLIGNGTGFSLSTLTAASGISIVNSSGNITIGVNTATNTIPGLVKPGRSLAVASDGTLRVSSVDADQVNSVAPSVITPGIVAAQITSVNASSILGILSTSKGGTGLDTSTADNGKLLIGTGTGLALANLTAGASMSITNTSGGITIDFVGSPGGGGYSSPLTTKGDLWTYSTVNTRLGVGSNDTLLIADSTQAAGLIYRTLLSTDIPNLDVAKITTGTFATSFIPSLDTSKITTGIFNPTLLPIATRTSVGAVKIGRSLLIDSSGLLRVSYIDADQINSVAPSVIAPGISTTQITLGTLPTSRGGTGVNASAAGNGTLLIGTGSGLALSTLTAGANVNIVNSSGGISVSSTTTSSYYITILASTPTAYYRLGDNVGSGSAFDSSGNGNTGTIGSTVTFGQSSALAYDTNTSASFSSGGSVAYPGAFGTHTPGDGRVQSCTHELWFKTTASGSDSGILVAVGTNVYAGGFSGFQALYLSVNLNASGRIYYNWYGPTYSNAGPYNDGVWHHLVVTIDNNVTYYVDGVNIGSNNTDAQGTQITYWWLYGCGTLLTNSIQHPFQGTIDEIAFYNGVVLSQATITAHYNAGRGNVDASRIVGTIATSNLPIATRTTIGAIKIGRSLLVDSTGLLRVSSVDADQINSVAPSVIAPGIVAGQISSVNPSSLTGSGTVPLAALTGITTTQLSASAGIVAAQIASVGAASVTTGLLATTRGGTGLDTSTAANGKLLIGTGTGLALANLTAGASMSITNTSGGITIDFVGTGGGGYTSPLTTKGDLWTYSTVDTRLGVGVDNRFLAADSSQSTGLIYRVLNASDLPIASSSSVGAIKPGSGMVVSPDGTLRIIDINAYQISSVEGSVVTGPINPTVNMYNVTHYL